ncbi:TetR family transcriptional regulator [Pseudomonas sp. PCH199]|uniref:TetR/AcrR family transcriptional regulator n=1 Tax=unclassified Pseudomonas TaxID=196821 RepID=UPI000BD93BB5|nr:MULTISPECIES: TetR family transcriptional regulator [unclassified Pseudomonas]MCW8278664.1 TetR family transcriptional regulator [Pseudomonas sp. PCH199]PAM81137.1 TetR family transcriptional regulator [Pseudomonas sp. ERMR1:02]
MKVSKAQAQANRAHIIETASTLFRERGFDGASLADLMGAAGFTHGGFYKHFGSKTDLIAESSACGFSYSASLAAGVEPAEFIKHYLSREHRDEPGAGCTIAALSADASRQPEQVKKVFADGLELSLTQLEEDLGSRGAVAQREARARRIDAFAQMVGAIMLSRACPDDSPLADEILEACCSAALARLPMKE